MQKGLWISVVSLIALAVVASIPFVHPAKPKLQVKAYFDQVGNLHPGASVRLEGVDVGQVAAIRVIPKLHNPPIEVSMWIDPRVDLSSDSIATLSTEGLLGPT